MSTTIEQKVVEMKFDNKQFENNVQTSMSTLEKLKQSLKLDGAVKGLENVNTAAKNFNMSGMDNSIETVRTKFSALQVMGVTALANITNSAINAGKRITSALAIEPIMSGFSEYELKIDSIRTIMASTGESIETVNKYLDELNTYSDRTIYSFSDMTENIGKFTNAGVKLEDAVLAIKGISNEAAVSGANANEASRAMYNFAQALSSGSVKLIDWKSIELANMATLEFKNELLKTAEAIGTVVKINGQYKTTTTNAKGEVSDLFTATSNFNESLNHQWMTTDVLVQTLARYSDETTEIGRKAYASAEEVTKLTQMFDVLKETAQSGWSKTWELIFGAAEQAKAIFTPLTKILSDIIQASSDFRNNLIEGALNSPFGQLAKKIENATVKTEKIVKVTKDYSDVVNKVINGDFGTGEDRFKKLTKAGYDWAYIQNLVNEKLGNGTRHATKFKEEQKNLTEVQQTTIEQLTKMSDAQLKNLDFTEEEISAFRELAKQSEKTGIPIQDLINNLDLLDGRTLLIESLKNIGKSIITVFTSIKTSYREIFPPMTSDQLYNVIAGIHELTTHFIVGEEAADKIRRTLKGLFSILDIVLTVIGGPIKFLFRTAIDLLGLFNINVLDITASIGDSIVEFRKWIKENNLIIKGIEFLIPYIQKASKAIREWINSFKGENLSPTEMANAIVEGFAKAISYIGYAIGELKKNIQNGMNGIPGNIISGLVNGIKDKIGYVGEVFIELGNIIIEKIKDVLGIHSPSREFFEIGSNIIAGLINGIQNGLSNVWNLLKGIGEKCVELMNDIPWDKLISIGAGLASLFVLKKIADALESLAYPIESIGDLITSASKILSNFSKVLGSFAFSIKAKALKNIAISLAILVGSIALLTLLDMKKVKESVGVLAILSVIIGVLSIAIGKFGPSDASTFGKFAFAVLGVSASLLIMSFALKSIASLKLDKFIQSIAGLITMIGLLTGLLIAFGYFVKGKSAQNIDKAGITILKMSLSILLMSFVMKQVSKLKPEELLCGFVSISLMSSLFVGLIAMTKLIGKRADKVGGTLLKMSASMLIMVIVMKQVSKLKPDELLCGFVTIGMFSAFFVGLIAMTKLIGSNVDKVGSTLLKMSLSMLVLVFVIQLVSLIKPENLIKGILGITALSNIVIALIAMTRLVGGSGGDKIGRTLLAMSISIGILAGISVLLGFVDLKGLAKGIIAVGLLSSLIALMIVSTRGASDCKGNLIAMTVAIGVMAVAVASLSLIDPKQLAVATLSLSTLIGVFALLVKASESVISSVGSMVGMGVMALAIVGLVTALYFLSSLPIEQMKASAFSLSELILSLSVSMALIGKAGNISVTAMVTVVLMTGVVAALAYMLHKLKDLPIESTFGIASSLSILLLSLSASCLILGAVGLIGPAAFIGLGMLAGLVAEIASLALIVAGLSTAWPEFETLLNKGMPILEKISKCIGKIFGNIVAGFAEGVMSCIPAIGSNLSAFMENSKGFIDGMASIDPKILKGATALAGAILALTAAELIQSIASFLGGNISFAMFGSELGALANGINNFAANLGTFDKKQLKSIECGAKAIKILAEASKTIPNEGGLLGGIVGENNIDEFGARLVSFGLNLKDFAFNLGAFDKKQINSIECASKAIKILAKAASEIPNSGGWLGGIVGDNNIDEFSARLPSFATNFNLFATNLGTFGKDKVTTIGCAADSIKKLAKAASEIPNSGGWLGVIVGDNNIDTFAGKLPELGTAISGFATNLGTFDDSKSSTVSCAAKAIKNLASAASDIPKSGGWMQKIVGDNDVETFGQKLPALATAIKEFSYNLGTFDDSKVNTVNCATKAIKTLITTAGALDYQIDDSVFGSLGEKLPDLGTNVKTYSDNLNGMDPERVNTSITIIGNLNRMLKSLKDIDTSGVTPFMNAINMLRNLDIKGFVDNFSGSADKLTSVGTNIMDSVKEGISSRESLLTDTTSKISKSMKNAILDKKKDFKYAGETLYSKLLEGISGTKDSIDKTVSSLISNLTSAINSYYTILYNAGSYLVSGFANGINDNSYKAEAKARDMASVAASAAKKELDEHSPSKVFYKIGDYAGQGFVNALDDNNNKAYKAGSNVANYAKNGLNDAIKKVVDFVNGHDIDVQPTIRPVLDLSDVESGVGAIGGMLNGNPLEVSANLSAINSMMNVRGQNGPNSDVISAINKLRKDLGNVGNTTYQVNGITYDDGSNISNAVKDLVRAAKIGRRI